MEASLSCDMPCVCWALCSSTADGGGGFGKVFCRWEGEMVQGTGFEPAKHYAQRPERCPFDRSGTPAWINYEEPPVFQNGEHEFDAIG